MNDIITINGVEYAPVKPPPFSFAVFTDHARAAKTLEALDDLASLITAYPRDQQPELSEEVGRARKRIQAGAKK